MANHRSAMGKTVDMSSLIAKHENTRAVGNMKVNARGDTIDAFGRVIQPVTEKVNQAYSNTVGTRSAQQMRKSAQHQSITPDLIQPPMELEDLTPMERELEESFEDDIEVEKIKAEEVKKGKK